VGFKHSWSSMLCGDPRKHSEEFTCDLAEHMHQLTRSLSQARHWSNFQRVHVCFLYCYTGPASNAYGWPRKDLRPMANHKVLCESRVAQAFGRQPRHGSAETPSIISVLIFQHNSLTGAPNANRRYVPSSGKILSYHRTEASVHWTEA
jgi:hypothetical protein